MDEPRLFIDGAQQGGNSGSAAVGVGMSPTFMKLATIAAGQHTVLVSVSTTNPASTTCTMGPVIVRFRTRL